MDGVDDSGSSGDIYHTITAISGGVGIPEASKHIPTEDPLLDLNQWVLKAHTYICHQSN